MAEAASTWAYVGVSDGGFRCDGFRRTADGCQLTGLEVAEMKRFYRCIAERLLMSLTVTDGKYW